MDDIHYSLRPEKNSKPDGNGNGKPIKDKQDSLRIGNLRRSCTCSKDNLGNNFDIATLFDNEEMSDVEPDGTAVNQIEHQVGLFESRLTSIKLKY